MSSVVESHGRSRCTARWRWTDDEKLIREFVLQLKLGRLDTGYFREKFRVDVMDRFREPLRKHAGDGWLETSNGTITLTREGLLRVDSLLPEFFLPRHRDARYA